MPPNDKWDYEVGYGKPPRHTRFKKGQSGNPRGRCAGSKNLSGLLSGALNELVVVAENGGRRKISKRQAIIKQLVNRSAKGDCRARCRYYEGSRSGPAVTACQHYFENCSFSRNVMRQSSRACISRGGLGRA